MEPSRRQDAEPGSDSRADEAFARDRRSSTFRSGDLLCNRFRVLRFIARGGMGELYEAEDLELGEPVALKSIRTEIADDDRANQRFRREVQLARKVTHPNICRIFDLFHHVPSSSGRAGAAPAVFVTMELLQGETLAERLKRDGRMTVEQALPLIVQMATALSAAHDGSQVRCPHVRASSSPSFRRTGTTHSCVASRDSPAIASLTRALSSMPLAGGCLLRRRAARHRGVPSFVRRLRSLSRWPRASFGESGARRMDCRRPQAASERRPIGRAHGRRSPYLDSGISPAGTTPYGWPWRLQRC